MNINLHMHSICSDGTLSLSELAELITANNIHIVSLTDHDTMHGVVEFAKLCKANHVTVIPGVEISARTGTLFPFLANEDIHSFHILAYFPTEFDLHIVESVQVLKEARPNVDETIQFIHKHNGIAILAHPYCAIRKNIDTISGKASYINIQLSNFLTEQVLSRFIELSIDGIEAYYEKHSEDEMNTLARFAKEHQIMTSIGTDYHRLGDAVVSKYNNIKKDNFIIDSNKEELNNVE